MIHDKRVVLFALAASLGLFWTAVSVLVTRTLLGHGLGPWLGWSVFIGVTLFLWWIFNREYRSTEE